MSSVQDFPYNMQPGIEHHIVWNPAPLSQEQLEQVPTVCRLMIGTCKSGLNVSCSLCMLCT